MPHKNSAIETLLAALQRIIQKPRPLRAGKAATQMFAAIATARKIPDSWILSHLSNPLVLGLAGNKMSSEKFTNALFRDTVSVNLVHAGYQINVIPESAEAQLDCRLLPETDAAEFGEWLKNCIADSRIKMEMIQSSPPSGISPCDGAFYRVVSQMVEKHVPGAGVVPLLMAGATDGRYWRARGYPAYGFTPMILDKTDMGRVHGIDERISIDNLLLGISMTRDILQTLCA
jgi:carboxypeptidase PM20D1